MRTSQYLLSTLKGIPNNAEATSHRLMLRAGIIRKLASGLYTWLPTGTRVLKKVENIVREEMNKADAIEILMPMIQPAELWQESGRWDQYNSELLYITDLGERLFVLGPTHEEVITYLIRKELSSYKQLPLTFFQIQTKFRNEIRPRFGVISSREFLMKDAYSFHTSQKSLQKTYSKMHEAYGKIFSRIGIDFCTVQANSGSIGGNISHEFQALVKNDKNNIVFSDSSNYAASIDFAEALAPSTPRAAAMEKMTLVDTPKVKTVVDLVKEYNIPIEKTVKITVVKSAKNSLIGLIVRGDHELNKVKANKLPQVASPLTFATREEIRAITNSEPNYLGPINTLIPIIIDRSVATMSDFVAGANVDGKHYFGINWDRDLATPEIADIRNVIVGDPSPDGKGYLQIKCGIEIGHTFQLGDKYSLALKAVVQNDDGVAQVLTMGCYGIGITRTIAAIIEQNHDEHGIIWPDSVAPFQVVILPINMHKSCHVKKLSERIYNELCSFNIDVLIDDRQESPGVMFTDMELIGIPHTIVISDRNLKDNNIEYKNRRRNEKKIIKIKDVLDYLINSSKGIA